ncbi:MAG: sporulation protein YqfD [Eubacteriaceae bacterium]|nr:sporulation protein YqfD [Eubacteriaceae bacterium]
MNEFILSIISRFGGYSRVRVVSTSAERLFNVLSLNHIPVWSITSDGARIYFNVRLTDMSALYKIAAAFGSNVVIVEKFGALKWKDIFGKYRLAVLVLTVIMCGFHFLSAYVWNIEIYGARLTDEGKVREYLYSNGYRSGMKKSSLNKTGLEILLKDEFENITEVTSDIDGAKLKITVFESLSPIVTYDRNTPVDIVAIKDCVIDEIDVYNGVGKVKAGDEVKKGDVLISGRVDYVFREEENFRLVHAIGKTLSFEKVFCDNIYVDMYKINEDAEYSYERRFYLFGRSFSCKSGEMSEEDIPFEMKNLQISLGWLNIPILYDEIRWYNKENCTLRSDEEIYEDVYESSVTNLPAGYTVKKLSYVTQEVPGGKLKVSVEMDCSVNIGIEREIS